MKLSSSIAPILATALVTVAAQSASAAVTTFSFQQLVDTNVGTIDGILGDGSAFSGNPGEAGFKSFDWTQNGTTVSVSASQANGGTAYAYLDEGSAGLGVCKILDADNECNPSHDDNVTIGEILNLNFNKVVTISSIIFRDADHFLSSPLAQLSIDGSAFATWSSYGSLTGSSFAFKTNGWEKSKQFYIDTVAVPEPLTIVGSLAALGVGAALKRKQEQEA
ncbi:MAG: PEP-CTERM sorting domain-containing protein [Prochlorothrix sp.]